MSKNINEMTEEEYEIYSIKKEYGKNPPFNWFNMNQSEHEEWIFEQERNKHNGEKKGFFAQFFS